MRDGGRGMGNGMLSMTRLFLAGKPHLLLHTGCGIGDRGLICGLGPTWQIHISRIGKIVIFTSDLIHLYYPTYLPSPDYIPHTPTSSHLRLHHRPHPNI